MPSPIDAAAKKPKQLKPVRASNVYSFKKGGSASSDESEKKDSEKKGSLKSSEYQELIASLTEKCADCGTPCLPYGRVGQKGGQVCSKKCNDAYYLKQDQRRDELYKSVVNSEPHPTRRRHQKE